MSQPSIVSRVCPSRLTSMIATRLSRPSQPACWKASHIEPSAISESPHRHHTRYGRRASLAPPGAPPTPPGRPPPRDAPAPPVGGGRRAGGAPPRRGGGGPSRGGGGWRNVAGPSPSTAPPALSTE